MNLAVKLTTELRSMQCGTCGVWHAIPETMYQSCLSEGGYWHCPNGHSRGYSEGTDKAKIKALEAELEQTKQVADRNLRRLNDEQKTSRHLVAQLKGSKTRLANTKKRIANGVCPCCNRTFVDLQRHMHNKHPDYQHAP